jgi:hypothetical protein
MWLTHICPNFITRVLFLPVINVTPKINSVNLGRDGTIIYGYKMTCYSHWDSLEKMVVGICMCHLALKTTLCCRVRTRAELGSLISAVATPCIVLTSAPPFTRLRQHILFFLTRINSTRVSKIPRRRIAGLLQTEVLSFGTVSLCL